MIKEACYFGHCILKMAEQFKRHYEFLQNKMKPINIATALTPLLDTKSKKRETMLNGFNIVRKSLGIPGVYDRAAETIITKTKHEHD